MLKATFVAMSAFETSCIQGIGNDPWVRQDEMLGVQSKASLRDELVGKPGRVHRNLESARWGRRRDLPAISFAKTPLLAILE